MLFLVLAGLIGAGLALVLLWPFGVLIACIASPFAGGIAAALAALWLGWRAKDVHSYNQTMDGVADEAAGARSPRSKADTPAA